MTRLLLLLSVFSRCNTNVLHLGEFTNYQFSQLHSSVLLIRWRCFPAFFCQAALNFGATGAVCPFFVWLCAHGNESRLGQSSRLLATWPIRSDACWGAFYRQKSCADRVPGVKRELRYSIYLCKHSRIVQVSGGVGGDAPLWPAIIPNPAQSISTEREKTKTLNEHNTQGLSTSPKSLESIFLYCSLAVRICLNEA